MKVTVVLCTCNRCSSLPTALDSVAAQLLPDSVIWEVVVVDNNSTDQTREVAGGYCRKYPERFRYVFEPQQGLSRARNAGICAARGEVIAFLDDDVIAEATWLKNLTASLQDRKWAGAGGRIVPPQDFTSPAWLTVGGEMDLVGALLPLFDLGDQACEMKRPPYGTNMAFRKEMFDKHGMFRTDLGRCGSSLLMGEDTEFGNRLMSAGECLRYEPLAVVEHPVPQERLSKKWFRAWWFGFGRTRIIERTPRLPILGIPHPFFSLANLVMRFLPVRTLQWVFTFNTRSRFYKYCQVWLTLGEIAQTYRTLIEGASAGRQPSSQSIGKP
jgi:glycosyltransferase involved in cell wall biosynthesis